jgi:3-oxoacyl-[acyl-carrier-protein] synthase II
MTTPHLDPKGRPIVAVTGMGVITSLGRGKDGNWRDLTAGRSGVRRIPALPRGGLHKKLCRRQNVEFPCGTGGSGMSRRCFT